VTLVVDASMVVAALVDSGTDGRWAEALLAGGSLAAPHPLMVEAANILRRSAASRAISAEQASLAHADLLDLRVEFFPYAPFAARIWELRENVTCYEAWYVAVAAADRYRARPGLDVAPTLAVAAQQQETCSLVMRITNGRPSLIMARSCRPAATTASRRW
jgi:predicted nucleic acid-binding protein